MAHTTFASGTYALVLSGGVALGAFEGGIYAAMASAGLPGPHWVAGSSAGALNAAIIAGNAPDQRVEKLRAFWDSVSSDPTPAMSFYFGAPPTRGAWRRAHNRTAALETFLLGRPGLFRPRLMPGPLLGEAPSLYDLEPLYRRLPDLVDFDRLNGGDIRISLVATDVTTGERVVFDTGKGSRIGPEHVVASCALLPVFAPIEVEGRLLGDGGLAANAPLDLLLDEPLQEDLVCILVELFAAAGQKPQSLAAALSRAEDLGLSNQTQRLLEGFARNRRLQSLLHQVAERLPDESRTDPALAEALEEARSGQHSATLIRIAYRAGLDEPGAGKLFDFSRATTSDRWRSGETAMQEALNRLRPGPAERPGRGNFVLHEIEA